jgi:hypothetical protein
MECRHRIGIKCKYIKFSVIANLIYLHFISMRWYRVIFLGWQFFGTKSWHNFLLMNKNVYQRNISWFKNTLCTNVNVDEGCYFNNIQCMHIINNKFWNIQAFIYGLLSPKERIGDWNLQVPFDRWLYTFSLNIYTFFFIFILNFVFVPRKKLHEFCSWFIKRI